MIRDNLLNIQPSEYKDVLNEVFFYEDKLLLSEPNDGVIDVNKITSIETGRHIVKVEGTTFEILYINNGNSDRLFIVLMGSRMLKYPEFKRWSWGNTINANILYVADPNYKNEGSAETAFYIGYRRELIELINKFKEYNKVLDENLYFYASSAGGITAIHISPHFKNCNVITINSHIQISPFKLAELERKNSEEYKREKEFDEDFWDNKDILLNNKNAKYTFAINIESKWDMTYTSMLEDALGTKFQYGINKIDNIGMWMYQRDPITPEGHPHSAQDNRIFYLPLEEFHDRFIKNDEKITDYDRYMYFIIGELYSDKYRKIKVK